MSGGTLQRASRAYAFVRHMPAEKLLRRFELDVRRRVRDRWPAREAAAVSSISEVPHPPLPLFAPRLHFVPKLEGGETCFTFLNRSIAMPGGRIDWSAPGPGAAHQLWRMNLHYMEYLEGLDDGAFARFVVQWLEAAGGNPRGAWRDSWNSYALSLRTVVWMQQLALRGARLDAGLAERMRASLCAQLCFLEANLETDLGGNHLIKNIKALLWASAFFEGDHARRWRNLGCRLLAREIDRQILPDGMQDERSASYHAQVFADLLECRHALGSDPFGAKLDAVLSPMAQVIADLTHPDGGPVLFNDAGLSMAYRLAECLDVYERLSGSRPEPRRVFGFPSAGYFGCRAASSYLVADCGRIAPDDLPAHGHGDVLSFEWSVGGERFIVDQGVFEYVAGAKRQSARSALNHNTLCMEAADQADFFGAFRCGRRPDVEVLRWQPRDDGFVLQGTHDGFRKLPGRPRHIRRFEVSSKRVALTDTLEGASESPARIGFLLHPGVEVSSSDGGIILRRGAAVVAMSSTGQIAAEPAVWWPDMGVEHTTQRLVIAVGPGPVRIETVFNFIDQDAGASAHS